MNTAIYAQAAAVTALFGAVTSALIVPLTAQAQDSGGIQTRLALSQSVSANRNASLSPANSDPSLQAQTTLNYTIKSETRTEAVNFNAVGVLRGVWLEDADADVSITPRVSLSYKRDGATSAVSAQASASLSEIAYTNALLDFVDADGNLDLPDDFDDLTGTGTRRSLGFSAQLRLREDAPFGVILDVAYNDLSYKDVSSTDLIDNRTASFGISGRFDINEAVQANLGLRYQTFENDANTSNDNLSLNGKVNFAQPVGSLGLSFNLNSISDNTSAGFQISRALDLPNGKLSGSLGLSRNASNDISTTGSLGWSHEYARGTLTTQFSRGITTGNDDDEKVLTSLSVGTSYGLTPTSTLNLNAGYAQTVRTDDDTTTGLANFGISYAHTLTPDWSLSAGASYQTRTSTGVSDAEATSLSLTLNRVFEARR